MLVTLLSYSLIHTFIYFRVFVCVYVTFIESYQSIKAEQAKQQISEDPTSNKTGCKNQKHY